MATLSVTLALDSTDATSDELSVSVTDALTIGSPSVGLAKITATTTGANSIIVPTGTAVTYLYVRHTGFQADQATASTDNVDIEDTAEVAISRLAPGEFAFFPANKAGGNTGIQLQTSAATVVCEYGYWTKA